MLDRATARKPIGEGDFSGCYKREWGSAIEETKPFLASDKSMRAAQQLDAAFAIAFEPCPTAGWRLNSLSATKPTDVNSLAVKVDADRAATFAMEDPYKIERDDLRAVMLAQAYYFDRSKDSSIPISPFVDRSAKRSFESVRAALAPYVEQGGRDVAIVFDRSKTSITEQLAGKRLGWFSAIASQDTIYVSPTIVRAAVVSCAGATRSAPSVAHRLRTEILPVLKNGKMLPSDARGITEGAEAMVSRVENCISDQLAFLFGHELAHSMLLIKSEEEADCIGAAVAHVLRGTGSAVFGQLIFQTIGTTDEGLLDAGSEEIREIACRRDAPYLQRDWPSSDLGSRIKECKAREKLCSLAAPTIR